VAASLATLGAVAWMAAALASGDSPALAAPPAAQLTDPAPASPVLTPAPPAWAPLELALPQGSSADPSAPLPGAEAGDPAHGASLDAASSRRSKGEPARARRKPTEPSAGATREKSKERRRSKLIDPYR